MSKLLVIIFLTILAPLFTYGQWSDNPAVNTQITSLPGEDVIPKVGIGPNGDYFIGYFSLEQGNYNVRLQRLDKDGNILWADDGILISDHPSMSWLTDWDMAVDQENHAILTWQDIRSGGPNNVVAYRISPDGNLVWGDDGIMLSDNPNFDVSPKATITSGNHAVFAWQSENNIIMQKVSPDGTKQWGEWGNTISYGETYSWPQLLAVSNDEVIIKFYEDAGVPWAPDRLLMAQRIGADGSEVWDTPTLIADDGSIQAWYQIVPIISDGNDGFYIAWHDFSQSGTAASAWVQHVNANGETQFVDNGVLVSNNVGYNQFYPSLAKPANDPNLYIVWREVTGNQNFWGIFGQKVLPDGSIAWGDQGKAIIPVSSQSVLPYDAQPAGEDIMVFYSHDLTGVASELRAMRVDKEGQPVWDDDYVVISSANSTKGHLYISPFANGQWVLSWEGDRTGVKNIFAQNIQPNGTLGVIEEMDELAIIEVGYVLDIFVDVGTPPEEVGLPESVVVTLESEETIALDVIWDEGNPPYDGDAIGSYLFEGTLVLVDGVSNPDDLVASALVVVVEISGSVSGHVDIEGDMADVTEVTVTLGEHEAHPDDTGFYQIHLLPAGTYEVTAHHPYTETQVVENVVIEPGSLAENVNFMLNMLRRDLKLMVVDAEDNLYASVEFFIEGPEGGFSESSGADEYVYVLSSLPYGFYQGTATLMDGFAVLEAEMVLDADHDEMVFLFLEVGLQETDLFTDMMVYPNPVKLESVLMVNSALQGSFHVQLFSVAGRNIVSNHFINLFAGINRLLLSDIFSLGEMQPGVYILHLSDGKSSRSIQFVINK